MKFCLAFLFVFSAAVSFGQPDSLPPYKRFPIIPAFKLLEVDSSSYFAKADLKKNKPVLIMLFNPDCEHCKHETEQILQHMDELQNVQIVMATMMPFDQMKTFYENYDLKRFQNVFVGRDFQYVLPSFYHISFLPFLAMYDKKGNLLNTFEGSMKIEDLTKVFK